MNKKLMIGLTCGALLLFVALLWQNFVAGKREKESNSELLEAVSGSGRERRKTFSRVAKSDQN